MVSTKEIEKFCNDLLESDKFRDYCHNGLQLDVGKEVKKLIYATNSNTAVLQRAEQEKADCLLVHHGFFWGSGLKFLNKLMCEKISLLSNAGCSLLAYHLPLDCHFELGNNAVFMKKLGFLAEPYKQRGFPDGLVYRSEFNSKLGSAIKKELEKPFLSSTPEFFGNWDRKFSQCFLVTGAGEDIYSKLPDFKDAFFMTGEIQEKSVYLCEEREFPIVTFGHTNSELYGVEALAQHLSKEFNMEIIKA